MPSAILPVLVFLACLAGVTAVLYLMAAVFHPVRAGPVRAMPYESGMDPIHDARRRFDVRFYLVAVAFLVFDVELLLLYPWAVAMRPAGVAGAAAAAQAEPASPAASGIDAAVAAGHLEGRHFAFWGAMVFVALLAVGFLYDWRKGVFRWR